MDDELLTPRQMAAESGADLNYIYRLLNEGVISSKQAAGRRFVTRQNFENWNRLYQIRRIRPARSNAKVSEELALT
jgi:hypothetical protein